MHFVVGVVWGCLFSRIRDVFRLLLAWWKGLVGMSVFPQTSGGEREREVELMCLDGLAWMMLALCCGRCLGLLVLEDAR